jgi:ufm1-conjugating enzyme 1
MSIDATTKSTVQKMPMLTVKAGPRDGDEWAERLKEELGCLIKASETGSAAHQHKPPVLAAQLLPASA